MRHRASRLYAVVAALLLALGAMCTAAGVASFTPSASGPSAASSSRDHVGAHARHESFAPRSPAISPATSSVHSSGSHADLVAALAAAGAGSLVLFGWLLVTRRRELLPPLAISLLGARAPPGLV